MSADPWRHGPRGAPPAPPAPGPGGEPSAWDLMTGETLAWMTPRLPTPPARLLEVGCGLGHVAAALIARGYAVTGVDTSAEAVAAARARGVDARRLRFPDDLAEAGLDGPFDAILFTRSFHHLAPLDAAVDATAARLAPGGRVLVEDWAWDEVDAPTAEWLYGLMEVGKAQGWVPRDEWRGGDDPAAHWRAEHAEHHEDLQPRAAMLAAVGRRLDVSDESRAPYGYRYVCRYLDGAPGGRAVAAAVLRWERRLIAAGSIVPIGMRFVAASGRRGARA